MEVMGKGSGAIPCSAQDIRRIHFILRNSLDAAKVGDKEKLEEFRRLERFTRAIEKHAEPRADFNAVIAHEKSISQSLGGRSVFDDVK